MDDLVERHAPLRQEGLRGALQAALAELEAGAARQQALLSLDGTEVGRLRSEIDAHRGWLRQRVERAQLKVDTFVGTLIKDELLRAIEGFGQLFRRRLPDEIMAVEDLTTIKRYLPGYIETAWAEFLNRQMIVVRSRLIEEMGAIGRLAESDLRDLLGERAAGLAGAAGDLGLASEGLRTLIMPRRGKHHASGIIKGLSLHGYIMLFFNPPLGVASLLAGHVIRRRYQAGMDAADVRAVAGAAAAAALDLERALVKRVEEQFAALAEGLKTDVASLYAEGISRIEESLAEASSRAQDLEGRRERLQTLRQEAIPALRRLLEDRHPEGHPEGTRA
jgi:hypothetical protein